MRPAFRATPFCSIHNVGLSASIRSFSSSPSTLLSRRIPTQASKARSRYAAIPLRKNPLLFTTITASAFTVQHFMGRTTTYLDSSPDFSTSPFSHGRDAKVPLSKDGGRSINPKAIRQISMGSILGLGLGVLVSAFSRMLVLLVGVGIVVSQVCTGRCSSSASLLS